ncbi:MAG: hypothetical protein N4A71_28130 [Carboxylicivirga sp.]|jgi:hypothetical protein|nr:hypothetical protein [Carboxylicivirga sp.]
MKALTIIPTLLISLLISVSTVAQRQSHRHHQRADERVRCEKNRVYDQNTCNKKDHYTHRYHSNHYKKPKYNHSHYNSCDHRSRCDVNNRRHYKQHHYKHHYHCNTHDVCSRRYIRRLPSRHYVSVRYGNDVFYYCEGLFYSFQPDYGYWQVNLKIPVVRYRPQHCQTRIVRGRHYYISNGSYYLPVSNGEYLVCRVY